MSCPHGEWHEEDCEICQSVAKLSEFEDAAYQEGFRAGKNFYKPLVTRLKEKLEQASRRSWVECPECESTSIRCHMCGFVSDGPAFLHEKSAP